jgi:aldose sugar dehydrogenase
MKNIYMQILFYALFSPLYTSAQGEPFAVTELNTRAGSGNYHLAHPFDIVYGPDDHLYITEKIGRILRVDTGTGIRRVILDYQSQVYFTVSRNGSGAATSIGQNGMLGLALHPNFGKSTGQDSIFVAYSYDASNLRISRFFYTGGATPSLTGETVLIEGLPTGSDHSTGRMMIGADNKLYYSCGDLGRNQFDNKCNQIRSQMLPTAGELSSQNYINYSGKILRLNLNGSVPADNPLWGGIRSHIYTIGHRNPQGLVWQKNPGWAHEGQKPVLTTGGKIFSCEHGPNTDDELNIIESGRNYGWPNIAGDSDNVNYQYVNWSTATNCNGISYVENPFSVPAGAVVTQELNAPASIKNNFRKPLKAVYTVCTPNPTSQCEIANGWLKYPTIAPSSVEFYNFNSGKAIPGWYPSLLVTTLRRGRVFRFKLNATLDAIVGDSVAYFPAVNRYRDIALSPDGRIFLITDSIGSTSGPSGSDLSNLVNKGSILVATFTGQTLPVRDIPGSRPIVDFAIQVYPNPASNFIKVEFTKTPHLPVVYRLYDITGKIVVENKSTKNSFTIPVDKLKRGVYILKLINGYGLEMRMDKVILQ